MFCVLTLALQLAIARCEVDQRKGTVHTIIMACRIYTRIFDGYTWISPLGKLADEESLQSRLWYLVKIPVALTQANLLLRIAMLQLPLHLYFIIRIRLSNEPLLSNGSDENQWGFGHIYALIMSAALVIECFKGYLSKCACLTFQRTISLCYDKGYSDAKCRFVEHNQDVSSAEEANAQLPRPPVASSEDGGAADMTERSEDLPRQVICLPRLLPCDAHVWGESVSICHCLAIEISSNVFL